MAVRHPYQDAEKAVLTLALKGGGLSLAGGRRLGRSTGEVSADLWRKKLRRPGVGAADFERGGRGLSATWVTNGVERAGLSFVGFSAILLVF
jgi:hypothetical protein